MVEGLTIDADTDVIVVVVVAVVVVVGVVVEKGDAVVNPFLGLFGFAVTSTQRQVVENYSLVNLKFFVKFCKLFTFNFVNFFLQLAERKLIRLCFGIEIVNKGVKAFIDSLCSWT